MEFLGDAILDFLVTRYVFVNYNQNITPGEQYLSISKANETVLLYIGRVTDIRQDLANNGRLAYILVACGLQTKILHNSTDLFSHISSYVGNEDLFPKDQSTDQYLSKVLKIHSIHLKNLFKILLFSMTVVHLKSYFLILLGS